MKTNLEYTVLWNYFNKKKKHSFHLTRNRYVFWKVSIIRKSTETAIIISREYWNWMKSVMLGVNDDIGIFGKFPNGSFAASFWILWQSTTKYKFAILCSALLPILYRIVADYCKIVSDCHKIKKLAANEPFRFWFWLLQINILLCKIWMVSSTFLVWCCKL